MTNTDLTPLDRLIQSSSEEWRNYIEHDFVRQLGAGTLDPDAFKHYLKQDYLFFGAFCAGVGLGGL